MKSFRIALIGILFGLPAQAQSPEWSVDSNTGIAHHNPSGGFCPTRFGGLPRTGQSAAPIKGAAAVCSYGPPEHPNAQLISIQEMPAVPRSQLDYSFRADLLDRFPGSVFAPEVESVCQNALTEKMGTPDAKCMVFERDGFTAFLGFHVIDNWSIQPMVVTSGKGLSEENIRLIGSTFAEIYSVEAQFMQLRRQ